MKRMDYAPIYNIINNLTASGGAWYRPTTNMTTTPLLDLTTKEAHAAHHALETLYKKWYGHEFESSSGTTDEWRKFATDCKKTIRKALAAYGLELIDFSRNHFEWSGFARNPNTGKLAYFSCCDVRYWPNNWWDDVLIRTAEHDKDYTGGTNQETTLQNIGLSLTKLTQ